MPPAKVKSIARAAAVILLLAAHFSLGFSAMRLKSPTFDETVHLTAGYVFWRAGDYRMNPENGIFPQRWAALPLLFDDGISFESFSGKENFESNEWQTSYRFLYGTGNNPESMFLRGRTMTLLLGLLLGITVFFISRSIFGYWGAMLSLSFYVFCPTMLAHSTLVTSDVASVLGFLLSAWTAWMLMQKITLPRLLATGFSLALLCLSKMSAPIIIPVILILLVIRLKRRDALPAVLFRKKLNLERQAEQIMAFAACGVVAAAIVFACIWASFGFRYSMIDPGQGKQAVIERNWNELIGESNGVPEKIVNLCRKVKLLPEAYLFGFEFVLKKSQFRYAYLNGECRLTGWWYFFPYCCLVKTPLPTIIMALVALPLIIVLYRRKFASWDCFSAAAGPKFYLLAPLIVLPAVYLIFATTSKMNIGHRHVLLLYPVAYIFFGATIYVFRRCGTPLKAALCALMIWQAISAIGIWPDYLAYFNQIAGGPKNGYKHLVDSSLDWGQDLILLRKKLDEYGINGADSAYISYFGTASIDHYLKARKLPSYFGQEGDAAFELGGGTYCISATMRTMVYMRELIILDRLDIEDINEVFFKKVRMEMQELFAEQKKPETFMDFVKAKGRDYWISRYRLYDLMRFSKLCRYIRDREPDDYAGYSILIYKLSDDDIEKAMAIPLHPEDLFSVFSDGK